MHSSITICKSKCFTADSVDLSASTLARTLFDICSQNSFIAVRIRKRLRERNSALKTFGSTELKLREFDVAAIKILNCKTNFYISIEILITFVIYSLFSNQFVDRVKHSYFHMSSIELPDANNHEDIHMYLLIGAGFYWQFATCNIKR